MHRPRAKAEQKDLHDLMFSTTRDANESATLEEAVRKTLSNVCEFKDWPVGHAYVLSDKLPNTLVSSSIWYVTDPEKFRTFQQITEQSSFEHGIGLPGRVMASGKPDWIVDVTLDPNFPRAQLARDIGVKAGFACPVFANDKVIAVLEFFAPVSVQPDRALLNTLIHVGIQIGRVAERVQAIATLSESETRNRLITNSALDGIVTIDDDGIIVAWNPAAEKIFGFTSDEITGKSLADKIIPPNLRHQHHAGLQRYAETGEHNILGQRIEITAIRKNGEEFPVELTVTPYTIGGGQFFTGFLRDISERKSAEKIILASKEEAEIANRTKSEFLANMSHELRTPLNAILGFSQMLEIEMFGPHGDKRYSDYATAINTSGTHLLQIINDILDISKIEAGETTVEETDIDIRKTMGICAAMVEGRAKDAENRVSIVVSENIPALRADERHVKQIVINLLSNAIKFTPAGGQVTVDARLNENSCMEIVVADTGIGIAAKDIQKVLQPFWQVAESQNRRHSGTGLGLPICKSLVELHSGDLTIDSEIGKGTTVTVSFPLERTIQL